MKLKKGKQLLAVSLIALMSAGAVCGCGSNSSSYELNGEIKEATDQTTEYNEGFYTLLDFEDQQEKKFAQQGLIAAPEALEIKNKDGKVVWSQKAYGFLDVQEKAPTTANPSLWRNAQLNHLYGLFQVTEDIYQVRGYDISNITFIKGKTGWIIFDPLISVECAQAALELVNKELGKRPVRAVVISHSHIDHYGGIKGVASEADVNAGKIQVLAPEGFQEHAVSENIYTGAAMGRRSGYQYGTLTEKGPSGTLSVGIGSTQSTGTLSFIQPTTEIKKTGQKVTVDGVDMSFQMTPGTEAPAEMNTWFPQFSALWMAENCTGTMHNLYTLRGAQVRDGNTWAKYIMEAQNLYGNKANVVFQSHNWPHFGKKVIQEYMENTASAYKFIHDQTLMYINHGYTSNEIARKIKLPQSLEQVWYTRQYYGTVSHNAKAVYQKYIGWYDGNPVNLNPLTPSEEAEKLVEYLGDVNAILEKAKKDFEKGEYQWVAQITNALVYQNPENQDARYLCADALEQLGYQAESGIWRNNYLSAAYELRNGTETDISKKATNSEDSVKSMTTEMLLDYLGILIDGEQVGELDYRINFTISDTKEHYYAHLKNGALLYAKGEVKNADATLTLPRLALFAIIQGNQDGIRQIQVRGDKSALNALTDHLTEYPAFFNIVEP